MDDLQTNVAQEQIESLVRKPALTREEAALAHIDAAIKKDLQDNPPGQFYDPAARAFNLIFESAVSDPEWASAQAHVFWGLLTDRYQRKADRVVRRKMESNPRQGWLALPQYAHVPQVLKVEAGFVPTDEASPEQYTESLEEAETQLRDWLQPRISEENLKAHRRKIREMKKARAGAARQYAGAPEMTMGQAMALHLANLETAATQQRRKAIKQAMKRRHART